jgi:hypothetical protein
VKYGSDEKAATKPNPLVAAFGKGKGAKENPPAPEPEEDDALSVSKSQIAAMKAFSAASTDEDKAKALKAFLKLC